MLATGYNFWSEWELQEKVDFDGINKIIRVYPHVTSLDIREDVWSASVRWLGMLSRGYDRFLEPMERTGLDSIPGGQTGDFYFLTNGWKLFLDFANVKVTGVLFSRDFDTAYCTHEGVPQYAAEVSSVVNTVTNTQNVVTGDVSSIPAAVWQEVEGQSVYNLTLSQDVDIAALQALVNALHEASFHRRKLDKTSNTITIYEADKVTPKYVFDTDDNLDDISPQ